jgi:hypothetical protein
METTWRRITGCLRFTVSRHEEGAAATRGKGGLTEHVLQQSEEDSCDRTTSKMRGFVSQDHIGGFSTKRECANTHK